MLQPTKVGRQWFGSEAVFQRTISTEPCQPLAQGQAEIGWVEWHCRELMEPLGYEPTLSQNAGCSTGPTLLPAETPKEYLRRKSARRWVEWHAAAI